MPTAAPTPVPLRVMRFRKPAWWDQPNHPVFVVTLVVLLVFTAWLIWWAFIDDADDGAGGKVPSATADSSQPTTSASTRPSANPPQLPDAASKPTKEGLEATVRFENDAINYAQHTGDLVPLKRVYDLKRCKVCASLVAQFEDLTSNGRYLVGASYTVMSVSRATVAPSEDGKYSGVVELSIKRDAGRQVEPDGRFIQEIEADSPSVFERMLSFDDGAWRTTGSRVTKVGQ